MEGEYKYYNNIYMKMSMNCKKCGKEIPDDMGEICEECKQKVIEELRNDENISSENAENTSKSESNEKTNDSNSFKNSMIKLKEEFLKCCGRLKEKIVNSKIYQKYDKLNKKIKYAILTCFLILIVLLILAILPKYNKIGNSIGNIRNYGYVASEGKWIYYLSPNEDKTQIGIYRTTKNGKNKENIYLTDMDIVSINAYKGYLYFIGISKSDDETVQLEDDDVDNKIYRIKANGSSDIEILNNNEFNNECFEIYVLDNHVYYIGTDRNIYKMKLNGTDKELVADNGTGYIGITEKYILYNDVVEVSESDAENEEISNEETESSPFETCIMNINGKDKRVLVEGQRLYSANLKDDYVYYTKEEVDEETDSNLIPIYRTKIGSNKEELIAKTNAYNLNLYENNLYYFNYNSSNEEESKVCIYKVNINGKKHESKQLKVLDSYSTFLNVAKDRIIYMDINSQYSYIKSINLDGNKEIKLYVVDNTALDTDIQE